METLRLQGEVPVEQVETVMNWLIKQGRMPENRSHLLREIFALLTEIAEQGAPKQRAEWFAEKRSAARRKILGKKKLALRAKRTDAEVIDVIRMQRDQRRKKANE